MHLSAFYVPPSATGPVPGCFGWLENHQKALEGWQRIRYPSRAKVANVGQQCVARQKQDSSPFSAQFAHTSLLGGVGKPVCHSTSVF